MNDMHNTMSAHHTAHHNDCDPNGHDFGDFDAISAVFGTPYESEHHMPPGRVFGRDETDPE